MKRLIMAFLALACVSAEAQQQGGSIVLWSGYTGTAHTYGWYVRNQAAGTGTNLKNGWGNYGGAYVWSPTGGSTGVGSGMLMIAANGDRNFGGIARATTFKANATNIGFASWAYNEDSLGNHSGTIVGLYGALSDLPDSKPALDAEIGPVPAAGILDSRDSGEAVLLARIDGQTVLSVPKDGQLQLHTQGTKPMCDATHRGSFWYGAGAPGVADTVEVCRKDYTDSYAWVGL